MKVRKYPVKNDILFKIHLNVSGPPKLKEIKIEKHFGNDKLIQLLNKFNCLLFSLVMFPTDSRVVKEC